MHKILSLQSLMPGLACVLTAMAAITSLMAAVIVMTPAPAVAQTAPKPPVATAAPAAPQLQGRTLDGKAFSLVDTMSHIFEQYFHTADNAPFQDEICEAALRSVMKIGGQLVKEPENMELRESMMFAGVWGLNGFLSMGTRGDWGTHDIEHAVSAVYDIPHAGGLAILFPNWMRQTYPKNPERFVQLAVNVFGVDPEGKTDEETAMEGIDRLRAFWKEIGAPVTLADYDIDDSKLDLIAEKAAVNGPLGGFAQLSEEEVLTLLKTSL